MLKGWLTHDARERFSVLLEADLRKPQDDDPLSKWSQLKRILQDLTAKDVGYCSEPNRDWFDKNNTAIQELLKNKHKYYSSKTWDTAVNPTETGLMRTIPQFKNC
ncbi:craniofacial development protein 2 [Biomphalaria glabrata]|nr:craniofacial development protein 2 [Biomphalaria glabrata]